MVVKAYLYGAIRTWLRAALALAAVVATLALTLTTAQSAVASSIQKLPQFSDHDSSIVKTPQQHTVLAARVIRVP